jgi:membrane associated rhomboid family serine protease
MSSLPYPPAESEAAPRCYRHRDRETWVSCTRCGRPICPDCLRPAAVGFQCPECVAEGRAGTRQAQAPYGGRVVQRTGLVTAIVAALNIAAFLGTAATSPGGFARNYGAPLFHRLELVPALVAGVYGPAEYWRLIGAAFLHIGPIHLLVNMLALAVVGPPLERVFGHWRFALLYLVSALGGSVAVYLLDDPLSRVAGASGAIYGLFAATVVVLRKLGLDSRAMIVTIVFNFALSVSLPGISLLGHLGGFIAGGLTALALVYTPRSPSRTSAQILALGGLLAVLVALVVYRTSVLVAG